MNNNSSNENSMEMIDSPSADSPKKLIRKIYDNRELRKLEAVFDSNHFPSREYRLKLAEEMNVSPKNIQVWFQNRRAREKNLRHKAEGYVENPIERMRHQWTYSTRIPFKTLNQNIQALPLPQSIHYANPGQLAFDDDSSTSFTSLPDPDDVPDVQPLRSIYNSRLFIDEPAHSIIEPAHSINELVHSINEPVHSIIEPAHSINEPVHSINEPVHSIIEPAHSITEPAHSIIEQSIVGSVYSSEEPVLPRRKPIDSISELIDSLSEPVKSNAEMVNVFGRQFRSPLQSTSNVSDISNSSFMELLKTVDDELLGDGKMTSNDASGFINFLSPNSDLTFEF